MFKEVGLIDLGDGQTFDFTKGLFTDQLQLPSKEQLLRNEQ